jgi:hypothetical protein
MTDQHVDAFGDGLTPVLSTADGRPVAIANVDAYDLRFSGSPIQLQLGREYLAVGRYKAVIRQAAVELFDGVGFSIAPLVRGLDLTVNRLGLQNGGARDIDSEVGSITLMVDDLCSPGANPDRIWITDASITEGDTGTTNAVFTV